MLRQELDARLSALDVVQRARKEKGYRESIPSPLPLGNLLSSLLVPIAAQDPGYEPTVAEWTVIGEALQLVQDAHHEEWMADSSLYRAAAAQLGGKRPGLLHRLVTVYLPARLPWTEYWPADPAVPLDAVTGRGITALRASHPRMDVDLARSVALAVSDLKLASPAADL